MTPALFARIKPALTVYSKNANADPNVAPREVLEALYQNDPGKVDKMMAQRMGFLPSGESVDTTTTSLGTMPAGTSAAGKSFTVTINAQVAGHRATRSVVVELTDDDHRPYLVEAWQ
jgi:general secretion pathway protein K